MQNNRRWDKVTSRRLARFYAIFSVLRKTVTNNANEDFCNADVRFKAVSYLATRKITYEQNEVHIEKR